MFKPVYYMLASLALIGCVAGSGSNVQSTPGIGAVSGTGVVTLSWTPPTTNNDGNPLTDLAGYKVYYGKGPGQYDKTIEVRTAGIAEYIIEGLSPGTYYFVLTVVDKHGNESTFSNEASASVE